MTIPSNFAAEFAEYMEFARTSGDSVDETTGQAITDWFNVNPSIADLYSVVYPMAALARNCSPFLGLWATAFLMGVEFERRRRDLAEMETLKA